MLKLLMLLTVFGLVTSPLLMAGTVAAKSPPVSIPAGQKSDQFDADFADEFDDQFGSQSNIDEILIADPIEGFNRGVFWFNDNLYFYLVKPIAKGLRLILPRQARVSVANAFSNAATPVRATNALLQFKFRDLATELYRFIFNTTVGVAGLFDPAASVVGLEKVEEDFGQTLGYYGAGHGFYLVLPVIGPSSLRDATGGFVDTFADPLKYADLATLEYFGTKTFMVVNGLSLDRDTYEGIVRDSLDPYLFIRAAYAQRRSAQVGKDGHDILSVDGSFLENEKLNPFHWLGL